MFLMQVLQKQEASNIVEFDLLGVNIDEGNVFKTYILGVANPSFNIDDNCPYNLVTCGVAGAAEQVEDVHSYMNNVRPTVFECIVLYTWLGKYSYMYQNYLITICSL